MGMGIVLNQERKDERIVKVVVWIVERIVLNQERKDSRIVRIGGAFLDRL